MGLQEKFEAFGRTYVVDLDTDMEGHGADHPDRVTGCWISYGRFSASLETLMASGHLYTAEGSERIVPANLINEIEAWAIENGY